MRIIAMIKLRTIGKCVNEIVSPLMGEKNKQGWQTPWLGEPF